MLFGLERLKDSIAQNALSEARVYGDRRLYRRRAARVAPGMLLCPVCGASARRFLAFGLHRRRNAECPSCGSVERHRLLWLYLSRHSDLARGRHRVLHTAPEPFMETALERLPRLRRISVDRFNPNADVQADLIELPFPDRRFDVVLSSHVLEHIRDDDAAIAELARVLRPGGWAANFMGRLCKVIGRVELAERMFARAVQLEPGCVEALRELRLINLRRHKSKGLIGRLLRR